jgi:hypothetical protein
MPGVGRGIALALLFALVSCGQGPADGPDLFDTWILSGGDWRSADSGPRPDLGLGSVFVYDEAAREVLLYGYGQTWTWNGEWTRLRPAASPRAGGSMAAAYDPSRQMVVVFGGATESTSQPAKVGSRVSVDETWTWDGVNWSRLEPVHRPPGAQESSMAWDPAANQLVLIDRPLSGAEVVPSTWVWDGVDWILRSSSTPQPGGAMYTDSLRNMAMALDATGSYGLSGGGWVRMSDVKTDRGLAKAMSFGLDECTDDSNTRVLDDAGWRTVSTKTKPHRRAWSLLAYDSTIGGLVMFGVSSRNYCPGLG